MRLPFYFAFISFGFFLSCSEQVENTDQPETQQEEIVHEIPEEDEVVQETLPEGSGPLEVVDGFIEDVYPNSRLNEFIEGDINKDGEPDLVILLDMPTEELSVHDDTIMDRKVVFLLQDSGGYVFFAEDDNIIECSDCGGAGMGDAYQGMSIVNDTVRFESGYGACQKDFITEDYLYDTEEYAWFLVRRHIESYNCNDIVDGEVQVKLKTETEADFGTIRFGE